MYLFSTILYAASSMRSHLSQEATLEACVQRGVEQVQQAIQQGAEVNVVYMDAAGMPAVATLPAAVAARSAGPGGSAVIPPGSATAANSAPDNLGASWGGGEMQIDAVHPGPAMAGHYSQHAQGRPGVHRGASGAAAAEAGVVPAGAVDTQQATAAMGDAMLSLAEAMVHVASDVQGLREQVAALTAALQRQRQEVQQLLAGQQPQQQQEAQQPQHQVQQPLLVGAGLEDGVTPTRDEPGRSLQSERGRLALAAAGGAAGAAIVAVAVAVLFGGGRAGGS